jgi:hypothetical protein
LGTGAVGVGARFVCVGAGVVVVGAAVVVGAVVGGWTLGSDFSPQPAVPTAAIDIAPAMSRRSRRHPAVFAAFTPGTVTDRAGASTWRAAPASSRA